MVEKLSLLRVIQNLTVGFSKTPMLLLSSAILSLLLSPGWWQKSSSSMWWSSSTWWSWSLWSWIHDHHHIHGGDDQNPIELEWDANPELELLPPLLLTKGFEDRPRIELGGIWKMEIGIFSDFFFRSWILTQDWDGMWKPDYFPNS